MALRAYAWRLLAAAGSLLVACAAEPPPSILLVTLDTLRRDHVGVYASEGGAPGDLTPQLDALAAEGLVHDAGYTTMPTTGPAHLSLLTGLHPSEHGSRRNGEPLLPEHAARDAARVLREHGYATAAFVTSKVLGREPMGVEGFEVHEAPALRRAGSAAVDAALAWLDAEPRRPVLLWVHLYDAHAPYGSPQEKRSADRSRFPRGFVPPEPYASPAERRVMAERYARGVRAADRALGRLVTGARKRLATPPLVIVVSDHGESLDEHLDARGYGYDHGEYLDPEVVTIALVLAGPGVVPGRSPGPASIRDLHTTLLEAAGVGDPDARREERRDLRTPSDAPRVVRIERRTFASETRASVGLHAAAAADGETLVVVAESGEPSTPADGASPGLLEAARAGLARAAPRPIDPELREALEALGYAE